MKGKIVYHSRSKHASIDKSNPNILTSSPAIDVSKHSRLKIPESIFFDKNMQLVKKEKNKILWLNHICQLKNSS
jgi:hypothetical protein